MNKSGFYKLMTFTVAVVIFVIVYRLLTVTPRTSQSLHKLNQSTQESNEKSNTEEAISHSLPDTLHNRIEQITQETLAPEQTQADSELPAQIEQVLEELQPHKYSEDPYIEAHVLTQALFVCSKEFADDQHILADSNNTRLDILIKKSQKNCAKSRTRYPNLLSLSDSDSTIKKISPTTSAGRAIKDVTAKDLSGQQKKDQINYRLQSVLKSKIGVLIAEAGLMSFIYFQDGETLPVSQWLNSQDIEYNRQVTQLAFSKMSCRYQDGMACQAISSHLLLYCITSENACGLDFDSYYQQTVMPGMQKDVSILIEKFEAMSETL